MTGVCSSEIRLTAEGARCGFSLPSHEQNIPAVLEQIAMFVQRQSLPEQHALAVVLRELLGNAVQHGNRGLASAQIRGEVVLHENDRFSLWVEDDGTGFAWQVLDLRLPAESPASMRHRGLILVQALVQELTWNESGNRVSARLQVERERRDDHGTTG